MLTLTQLPITYQNAPSAAMVVFTHNSSPKQQGRQGVGGQGFVSIEYQPNSADETHQNTFVFFLFRQSALANDASLSFYTSR